MTKYIVILLLTFASACKATDYATAEETAQMAELREQGDEAGLAALEDSIAERTVGGVVDLIDSFVPAPLEPFKGWLVGLGAMVAFKRPRKRLKQAIKSAASLNFKEAGMDLMKTVGLKHSSDDPKVLMEAAAKVAEASGDTDSATRIRSTIV